MTDTTRYVLRIIFPRVSAEALHCAIVYIRTVGVIVVFYVCCSKQRKNLSSVKGEVLNIFCLLASVFYYVFCY